jgi:hypothetical protein
MLQGRVGPPSTRRLYPGGVSRREKDSGAKRNANG